MLMNNNVPPPLLQVRDLKVQFPLDEGTVRAVDGVSFDVHPGQVVGIVGESGCGKSVTMKAILRIIEPPGRITDGEILYSKPVDDPNRHATADVIDIAQLSASGEKMKSIRGAEIALIPQEPMASFSPVHTVGSQIIEAIMLHRPVNKQESRRMTVELFHDVGIPMPEQRVDAYSWQLSGGLRQRAIIAMALSCNPRVLIADEPTTAVDVTTQAQVLRLLRELQERRNAAIIFITHDLGVIAQMAHYVIVMYLGRVMEQGPVDDIFHAPKHPYTEALLESIPSINAPARIDLPTISGSIPHPFNRPHGCPFHPRCKYRMEGKCDVRTPAVQTVAEGQATACFLYHDVAVEDAATPAAQGQLP